MGEIGFPSSSRRGRAEPQSEMSRDLTEASDAVLVMAISRWREDALAEAYRRHAGAVFGLARRVLAEQGMAEEITQEVFLRLWNDPSKYDPERGSLRTWLLAQSHGRAVDRVRADVARRRREEKDATQGDWAAPLPSLDQEVEDLIVSEQVRDAVADLPTDERRAIELAYFGGHSYRDVALMLDTPEGTIKSRIRSGMGRLRASLAVLAAGVGDAQESSAARRSEEGRS